MKRFIACFDNHGDMVDKDVKEAFFRHIKEWKPQIRIHGGDNWDFRCLRKKASEDEKRESMAKDWEEGNEFLEEYFGAKGEKVFIKGNHDIRPWELAESSTAHGLLRDAAEKDIAHIEERLQKLNVHVLPYHKRDGVYRNGHLKVIHGFWAGLHADKAAAYVYGSVLQGHVHTISEFAIPGLERRVARSCGALCTLDMDYNLKAPITLRHANGWAFGVIHDDGSYQVWQVERINGKFIVPTGVTEL